MNRRQLLSTTDAVASLSLCAGIVAGVPGCTPAPAAEPISPGLAFAIDQHRKVLADFTASCRLFSACEEAAGKLKTPETTAAMDAADEAAQIDGERETTARLRLMSEPVLSLADVRAKADYLTEQARVFDFPDEVAALVVSLGARSAQAAGPALPSDPMADIATAYTVANETLNASDIDDADAVEVSSVAHIDPLRDRLLSSAPTPTTMVGALAAARLAERSIDQGDWHLAEPLIVALRQFLEGRA